MENTKENCLKFHQYKSWLKCFGTPYIINGLHKRQQLWPVICSIYRLTWCISNLTGRANKHYNQILHKNMLSVQEILARIVDFGGSTLNETGGGRLKKADRGRARTEGVS